MKSKSLPRLPAEWEPQAGAQLTWPHAESDWTPVLDEVERCFIAITREIALREAVLLVCDDPERVRRLLDLEGVPLSQVRFRKALSNDTWARDHAPLTVYEDKRPRLCNFTFNGWGGKFPATRDDALSRALHEQGAYGDMAMASYDFVLEGGSIESDGAGGLLTTEGCLLNPNRNPGMTRSQIENVLCNSLGVTRVLWLQHGRLEGDDTDGHIDMLARFCGPNTIAFVACGDPHDAQYGELSLMRSELEEFRNAEGNPYRLVSLPMPDACYDAQGSRLPATYANFLVLNDAVLVPTYAVPQDAQALATVQTCFPDRTVVGVDCRILIVQHGSLHCVTMQFPEGVSL